MQIEEITLFISSTSRACVPCFKFSLSYKIPVKTVRLDTQETRDSARHGEFFQVTIVPTMVVFYVDGNMQLFVGAEKVLMWMQQYVRLRDSVSENRPHPLSMEDSTSSEGIGETIVEEEEEDSPPPSPPQRKKPVKKKVVKKPAKKAPKKRITVIEDSEEEEGTDEGSEGEEMELIEEIPPPRKKKAPTPKKKSTLKSQSRMQGIIDQAKKMEADRQATLGYNEKDLPKSL
jgi:hypothetical protein